MRALVTAVAVAAMAGVGWVEYATGPDVGFSLFYLLPVVACGWWLGRGPVAVAAMTASIAWFLADFHLHGADYFPVSLWNGVTRFVIFLSLGLLTAHVRLDREQLAGLNAQLKDLLDREAMLARTDALTGLPNSRAFLHALAIEAARSRRAGRPLGLAYLDVDNLKRVNDAHGHAAGDELLSRFATALRETLRAGDVPARLGGDEFAILFGEAGVDAGEEIARRVIERTAQIARDYPQGHVGVSVGVAFFQTAPEDIAEAIRRADWAMYEAKRNGKARVVTWIDGHV